MARGRSKPAGGAAKGRPGLPWTGIFVVLAIGTGVLIARTLPSIHPSLGARPDSAPAERPLLASTAAPPSAPTVGPASVGGLARGAPAAAATPPPHATPGAPARATPRPTTSSSSSSSSSSAHAAAAPAHATLATPMLPAPTAVPTHAPPIAPAPTATAAHLTPTTPAATVVLAHVTQTAAAPTPTAAPPVAASHAPAGGLALSFDAGADRGYAPDILDVLGEQHIPASFGITGQWAKSNPDLVRRIAAEGHMVINHTLDHRSFTGVSDNLGGLSPSRRRQELDDADAIIAPLLGHSTRPWYRLPYGDGDAHVEADVAPAGYDRQVGWTVDSLGWRGASDQDIITRCLRLAAPKAILLFHVGRQSRDGPALQSVIAGLQERGYSFVRADEL